jgi:hypothetical protein
MTNDSNNEIRKIYIFDKHKQLISLVYRVTTFSGFELSVCVILSND